MGGGLDESGSDIICSGDDVLVELNRVFGNPNSHRYKHAQAHNKFGTVPNSPGNYKDLIEAYRHAGLVVGPGWCAYLRLLGTLRTPVLEQGPQNIYDIAQFRYNGLLKADAMSTDVHVPEQGGHVHTKPGHMPGEPNSISSPCPLPPT
jgi:hypothetical protein